MIKLFLNLIIFLFIFVNQLSGQTNEIIESVDTSFKDQSRDTIIIVGVGDIMLGTDYPSSAYLPPSNDCSPLLKNVKKYLRDADVTFGNLEGVFAGDKGTAKKCNNPDQCYVFRMPVHYVNCIVDAGFDLVSVANNHVNDFGYEGRKNTSKVLKEAGLAFSGFKGTPYTIFENNGVQYGLCSFAPHSGTEDSRKISEAASIVAKLDTTVDIVIVSFHAGAEGKNHQHVTKETEYFYEYNRGNVYEFSHAVVDAGADIVFGHGPHVTRAIEVYKDRLICYSLGNFCTYRRFNLSEPNGFAPIMKTFVNTSGEFLKGEIIPIYQDKKLGGTKYDNQKRAITKIKELTDTDFPNHNLLISKNGEITLKDSIVLNSNELEDSIQVIIPTFLGNFTRNYYGENAPDSLNLIWKHYLGKGETVVSRKKGAVMWAGAGWTGQPLLVKENGKLFLIQGAYDHHLKKIDAETGKLVWQYEFDDVVKGTGTIWVNKNADKPENSLVILQGSRLGVKNYLGSKHIPSYRAVSYFTGKELWRMDQKWTHSYSRDVDGSALILNDTAYLGMENSYFTVFDPDHQNANMLNGMLQPNIIQERKLYTMDDVRKHRNNVVTESSPSLLRDRIYVASGSGHVFGYNLKTRELDWDFYTGSDMDGSAVVTKDSNILVSVEKQYIRGKGGAFKLDPLKDAKDAALWYYPVEDKKFVTWKGGIIGSIAVNDNYIDSSQTHLAAFVGIDEYLYVVDHMSIDSSKTVLGPDSLTSYNTPKLIFKQRVGPSISTPIFVDDKLIVAGYWGIRLFKYDKANHFELIDKRNGTFESTPIVWNNRIYIASRDGYLYCLGIKN